MFYVKSLLTIFVLVAVSLMIDHFFEAFNIPIVTMDLIFFPLSVFLIYFSIKPNLLKDGFVADNLIYYSRPRLCLSLVTLLLFLAFASVLMYIGFNDPLLLLDGHKGKLHGYSLFFLGIAIFLLFSRFGYLALYKRYKAKKRA